MSGRSGSIVGDPHPAGFPRALQKAIDFLESLDDDEGDNSGHNKPAVLAGVDAALRHDVVQILRRWGTTQPLSLRQIVSKKSLKHEIEECLPALQHLIDWRKRRGATTTTTHFVAVDVCGGKGIFSLLLKELAEMTEGESWPRHTMTNDDGGGHAMRLLPVLRRIILVELADDIDWTHLHQQPEPLKECNESTNVHHINNDDDRSRNITIPIDIWRQCNVNAIDGMIEKLSSVVVANVPPSTDTDDDGAPSSSPVQLVLTGIHLCGALSPSFLSICNGLGPTLCPCFCLVPCCMPKAVLRNKQPPKKKMKMRMIRGRDDGGDDDDVDPQQRLLLHLSDQTTKPALIAVGRYEDPVARHHRLDDEQRRHIAKKKLSRQVVVTAQDGTTTTTVTRYACWGCGRFDDNNISHQKSNCPDPLPRHRPVRPTFNLDVSHVLRQSSPCAAYCELLLSSVDYDDADNDHGMGGGDYNHQPWWPHRRVWETGIESHRAAAKQSDHNWNRNRKSIYIVVS
jgi:hypothetical protein